MEAVYGLFLPGPDGCLGGLIKENNVASSKAQDVKFDQNDNAVAAHLKGDVFRTGTVDASAIAPGNQMWFGSGNSPDNYNLTDNPKLGVETGLKIHLRQGGDVTPSGTGPNGEQDYTVPAGTQPGNPSRSDWNFDYLVNTNDGAPTADASHTLADFMFKMEISVSGPAFAAPKTDTFDLNPSTHVWTSESNPAIAFGGDDFNQPGATPTQMGFLAENSVNFGFAALQADFGTLAQTTASGTQFDIKLGGFNNASLINLTHDVVTVA